MSASCSDAMKHFGLIGCPLEHSCSAEYFTAKFAREGIDADYALFEIASIEQMAAATSHLDGFNVTIPYKKAVLPYLAHISAEAAAIGAVNCVRRERDGSLSGFNTDVAGIRATLALCGDLTGARAIVLGSGGAAAAVKYVLQEQKIDYIIVSRERGRGDLTYADLAAEVVAAHRLIINATPVGMSPAVENAPALPYDALTPHHTLFDLIYNPAQTRFLALGAERGARTVGGHEMFVRQAEASWRIWNGAY